MSKIIPADWRLHPIYLVALGFGFGLWFDSTWLAPSRLGEYRLEIASARGVVAKAEAETKQQTDRAKAAEGKIGELEKNLQAANRNAQDAVTANTFASGSPYPIGLSSIRLGTSSEDIEREIPKDWIKKRKGYWSVEVSGNIIESVTVYWDVKAEKLVVSQLTFWLNEDATRDSEFLKQKLAHVLGPPTELKPGFLEWRLSEGVGVFLGGDEDQLFRNRRYRIMGRGYRPAGWPAAVATGSIKR